MPSEAIAYGLGTIFLFIYPLSMARSAGWVWRGGQGAHYLQMICGVNFVLGLYLIRAA